VKATENTTLLLSLVNPGGIIIPGVVVFGVVLGSNHGEFGQDHICEVVLLAHFDHLLLVVLRPDFEGLAPALGDLAQHLQGAGLLFNTAVLFQATIWSSCSPH
jgi:hypothetical protein